MTDQLSEPTVQTGAPAVTAPAVTTTATTAQAAPPSPFYKSLPEDWRPQLAKSLGFEDSEADKIAKKMERYADLPAVLKSWNEATNKIREGKLSSGLSENPTPEELAEYREARGIPSDPKGYELSLDEGLILGDEDNRILENVFKEAVDLNIPKASMNTMVNAFMKAREVEADARNTQDNIESQQADRVLREHWGNDYKANINHFHNLMNQLPKDIKGLFMNARLQDARGVINSPEMVIFFTDIARKLNPAGTVVPNSANPVQAITDELSKYRKMMADNPKEFWDNKDHQQRYQQLSDAQQKMSR